MQTPTIQTPDICVYHGHCPDGFTAAWAVWKRFGDSVEYRHGSYGSAPPTVDGKHILLVDFSYKRDVLKELASKAASITVLDHHETAQADLQPLLDSGVVGGLFDMNRSGAGIAWDVLHPGERRPALIDYIEDRDLWTWKLPLSRPVLAYVDTFDFSFAKWDDLAGVLDYGLPEQLDEIINTGNALLRRHFKNCESLIAVTMQRATVGGIDVPCCNVPHIYCSEVGNILANRDDAPFSATFFINKDNHRVYSLRSLAEKQSVSAIALKYGGGGHRNAAGFRLLPGESL